MRTKNKPFRDRKRPGRRRGNPQGGSLHPQQLLKKINQAPIAETTVKEEVPYTYENVMLFPRLKSNILAKGYKEPTPIQYKSMEPIMAGRDVMGIAATGTGKTGAFLIPLIEQMAGHQLPIQTLIVLPTRELAQQVQQECNELSAGLNLHTVCLIGGSAIHKDIKNLKRNCRFVIGTPGRINDLMKRGVLRLNNFSTLILDEFDRMLDMGFVADIEKIVKAMRSREQTILYSATIEESQKKAIDNLLTNPVNIRLSEGKNTSEQVDQDIVEIPNGEEKYDILLKLIYQDEVTKTLIFAETKTMVQKLAKKLNKAGFKTDEIHGNKTQAYRTKALRRFKEGKVDILVATDVAARGIDVDDISHVINYQIPRTMDSYIHRIGRTGRAGKTGKAITLIDK